MSNSELMKGNSAFRQKNYQAAIEHYTRAKAINPELAHLMSGNIEMAKRRIGAIPGLETNRVSSVDVVVPVYNALEDVQKCLASLQRNTDGFNVRIIVVNDGSGQDTTQWLREFCNGKPIFQVVENTENSGYTKTINTGLRLSTADYVVIQNSDTIVSPGWLMGLIRCMDSSSSIGIVGPLSNAANWQNVPQLHDKNGLFAINQLPKGYTVEDMARVVSESSAKIYPRIPFVNGFCMLVRRAVIKSIGFMDDENFPVGYGEEQDYCIRALNSGYSVVVADDVYVFHGKSKSFGHERRKKLSKEGTESLKVKYGEEKYFSLVDIDVACNSLDVIREKINKKLISSHQSHDVIVCVHNACDDVDACIRSIINYSTSVDKIIVVDDYSGEKTVNMLASYQRLYPELIEITRTNEQSGYTKAANIGLKLSRANVKTLLNSDTLVTKGWADKIVARLNADPMIGVLGPLSNAASHQSVPSSAASETQTAVNGLPDGVTAEDINEFCEKESINIQIAPYTPLVHGFCMSITARCLETIGYFDEESFPRGYGEENDFCIRAQDAGFALAVTLDTYIYHSKSKSYPSEQRVKLMNDGWSALVNKHGKRRLQHAIKTMETHPHLIKMRDKVRQKFYKTQIIESTNSKTSSIKSKAEFGSSEKLKSIAFYLPQFHPTPENDANWGEGFTEWTNVVKAGPRFPEHYQPRLPGKLGFYDLRLPQVMAEQARMAEAYGVSGFCFYYYRFGDKRVLDTPLRGYLNNIEAKLPFCYCWANESWTRAWDGKTSDVLLEQTYDDITLSGYVNDISEAIADPRYIRINGKPIILIYQIAVLPEPEKITKDIRNRIRNKTGEEVLIGSVFSPGFRSSMLDFIDFVVQFPPHRIPRSGNRITINRSQMSPFEPEREDYYESYDEVIKSALNGPELMKKMLLGVCPDWDNAARRQKHATTLVGSTPEKFQKWVEKAVALTQKSFLKEEIPAPIIFINAWNEWAEGAVMEPSEKYGYQYLQAFKNGVSQ